MMISQLLNGCLKKPSLKPKKDPSLIEKETTLRFIKHMQIDYPKLLLCGSGALIFSGLMPFRNMSDIDFAINDNNFDFRYMMHLDQYSVQNAEDGYASYSKFLQYGPLTKKTNVLVFDNNIELRSQDIIIDGYTLKCQHLDDVLYWKEKYNRSKDKQDLDVIASKAVEDAIWRNDEGNETK